MDIYFNSRRNIKEYKFKVQAPAPNALTAAPLRR